MKNRIENWMANNFGLTLIIYLFLTGLITLGLASIAFAAEPVRIAIIDTGYDPDIAPVKLKLCKTGHYDFPSKKPQIGSVHIHGTVIGSIIAAELKDVDYCAVIYQVFDEEDSLMSIQNATLAFRRAKKEKLIAINASFEGKLHSYKEHDAILELGEVIVFAAAGNSNQDLDKTCNVYPACYEAPNVVVVGSVSPDITQKALYSNYGTLVKVWYPGDVKFNGQWQSGTSFAAPRALADYVRSLKMQ